MFSRVRFWIFLFVFALPFGRAAFGEIVYQGYNILYRATIDGRYSVHAYHITGGYFWGTPGTFVPAGGMTGVATINWWDSHDNYWYVVYRQNEDTGLWERVSPEANKAYGPGADCDLGPFGCGGVGVNPINPGNGNLFRELTDIRTFGAAAIEFKRNFNSRQQNLGASYRDFGTSSGWQHNWNYELVEQTTQTFGVDDVRLRYSDGKDYIFKATGTTGAGVCSAKKERRSIVSLEWHGKWLHPEDAGWRTI